MTTRQAETEVASPTHFLVTDGTTSGSQVGRASAAQAKAALAIDASDATFTQAGTGAVQRPLSEIISESAINVRDFGALGDGSGDTIAEWLTDGNYDRGYANLAAIQVDYPEANDLANTIDQVAHWRAFQHAVANSRTVWTPDGEYIFARHLFQLGIDNDFAWHLSPNAIIKRKDRTQISTWDRMLTITMGVGCANLRITGGIFDGNARQNPPPWSTSEAVEVGMLRRAVDSTTKIDQMYVCVTAGTTAGSGDGPQGTGTAISDGTAVWDWVSRTLGFTWEHSALLFITPANNHTVNSVVLDSVTFRDPTADGVFVFANSPNTRRIKLFSASNIRFDGERNRRRPDILWSPEIDSVIINNCSLWQLECEHEQLPTRPQKVTISDVTCRWFDISGGGYATLMSIYMTNVVATEVTMLGSAEVMHAVNCDFVNRSDGQGTLVRTKRFVANNCTFRVPYRHGGSQFVTQGYTISGLLPTSSADKVFWHFKNCVFKRHLVDLGEFDSLTDLREFRPIGAAGEYALIGEEIHAWDAPNSQWVNTALAAPFDPVMGGTSFGQALTTDLDRMTLIIEDSVYDSSLKRGVVNTTGGRHIYRRNTYKTPSSGIWLGYLSGGRILELTIESPTFEGVTAPLRLQNLADDGSMSFVRLTGEWNSLDFSQFSSGWEIPGRVRWYNERYARATSAPTGKAIIGDRVIVGDAIYKAKTNHITAAEWSVEGQLPPVPVDASAGDGNETLVAAMEFGKTYHVEIEETEALNGDTSTTFRLGTSAGAEDLMTAVTATGATVAYAVINGTEHVGDPLVLSWTNNATPTTGELTATVKVMA